MAKQNTNNDGDWEVVRQFSIPTLNSGEDANHLTNNVGAKDGVAHIAVDRDKHSLTVRYDLRKIQFDTIIKLLKDMGLPPKQGRWLNFRRSWYRFTEGNMRDLAKAPQSACCNKPPMRTKH